MRRSYVAVWSMLLVGLLSVGMFAGCEQYDRIQNKEIRDKKVEVPMPAGAMARHVIVICVDGLRPEAVRALGPENLPAIYTMIRDGSSTLNARANDSLAESLPNYVTMVTGRPAKGDNGHKALKDEMGVGVESLHDIADEYVESMFDVIHDHGLTTALVTANRKFQLFERTWAVNGRPDTTGADNGTNKISTLVMFSRRDVDAVDKFIEVMRTQKPHMAFLHQDGPDEVGRVAGFDATSATAYWDELRRLDRRLMRVINEMKAEEYKDNYVIILTSDHGGARKDKQGKVAAMHDGSIPLVIYGKIATPAADLYKINPSREDPGKAIVGYDAPKQPIRNGDIANMVTKMLGLRAVEDSTINAEQKLVW